MIRPEQVWLAIDPVDMRWGMDRLSAYVQPVIGRTPCDGSVYAFTNRDCSRLKLLAWDGNGVWLASRRLHRGSLARAQVPLARSTLSEWIGHIGVALQPLTEWLGELLRQQASLHADETPVQQLDPGKGKTQRAYLWVYRSNDLAGRPPIEVFY